MPVASQALQRRRGEAPIIAVMHPLVSVIIPTFNRRHVLGEAIDSVLHQTLDDLELIIVDDGSTDGTEADLRQRFPADGRVTVVARPNGGVASARNAGIELARGDLIAFLDSDDAWKPFHLELQVAALRARPEAGLVWADADAMGPDGRVLARGYLRKALSAWRSLSNSQLFGTSVRLSTLSVALAFGLGDGFLYVGDVFSAMVTGNLILTSAVVMRRERLERTGRFDERLRTGEDYEFFLRACREGPVAFVDVSTVRYRIGTGDRLSGPLMGVQMARAYLEVLERTLARDASRITLSPDQVTRARAHANLWVGEVELAAGDRLDARPHLQRALDLAPRPAVRLLLAMTYLPTPIIRAITRVRRASRTAFRRWRNRGGATSRVSGGGR